MLSEVFIVTAPAPTPKTSGAAKNSHLTALLVLSEIIKSRWYAAENHYALFVATVLTSVYALRFADSKKRLDWTLIYSSLALLHASDLIAEAQARRFDPDFAWGSEDVLGEFDVMWERRRLVADCASVLLLADSDRAREDRGYLANLVQSVNLSPKLWGFGAVPSAIVRYWADCRVRAGVVSEYVFAATLRRLLEASQGEGRQPGLPSPYYGFESQWASQAGIPFLTEDAIETDSFLRRVWFGRAMLFMLAKRNFKQSCKSLWPQFSRSIHEEPDLPSGSFYDARLTRDGQMKEFTFHRREWKDLVEEAVSSEASFLDKVGAPPWLIAAYIYIVPYRAWTNVLMWLDRVLNLTWYRVDHLPAE